MTSLLDEEKGASDGLSPENESVNKQVDDRSELARTAKLNRIELAKDIKRRHWVNDGFRDAYLNAVIEEAEEDLAHIDNGDWEVVNSNTGETHWEKNPNG